MILHQCLEKISELLTKTVKYWDCHFLGESHPIEILDSPVFNSFTCWFLKYPTQSDWLFFNESIRENDLSVPFAIAKLRENINSYLNGTAEGGFSLNLALTMLEEKLKDIEALLCPALIIPRYSYRDGDHCFFFTAEYNINNNGISQKLVFVFRMNKHT